MDKLLKDYISKYGDPTEGSAVDSVSQEEDSGLSKGTLKKLRVKMLEGRFRKEKGRGFDQGERALVENEGVNLGPEDLRQHKDFLTWLGAKGEDIDKALEESGAYKLETTPESAKEWGLPKMAVDEAKRVGGILARPFTATFKGGFHPISGFLKEAALIPAESLTGIGKERDIFAPQHVFAGRVIGTPKAATLAGAHDLFTQPWKIPQDEWNAIKKQMEGRGDEQEKLTKEFEKLGIEKDIPVLSKTPLIRDILGSTSKVVGTFADPTNLIGAEGAGAGAIAVTRRGINAPVVKAVGDVLAENLGTQAEKWAARVGTEAGSQIMESLMNKVVQTALKTEKFDIDLAKGFSNPKAFEFFKKIPYFGETGAKAITNMARSIPLIGRKFGVSAAEEGDVFRAIEGIREISPAAASEAAENLGGIGVRKGDMIFGTLKRSGSTDVRVAADEAMRRFENLSPAGQRAARWFVERREEFKALAGVTSDIEGYVPHVWEEGLFGAGKGKFALTKQKAKGLMQRAVDEGVGYTEHAEKAIKSRYHEIIAKAAANDAVAEIADHVAIPIPEGGEIPEGFVKVPKLMATRSGHPIPQIGGGKMMKREVYDELVRYGEAAKTVGGLKGVVQRLGNFFKSNILLAPGTAITNAVGGGAQYTGRIVENMVKAITGNGVKPLMQDVTNLLSAIRPRNVEKYRPELWGGKSALFSEIGKASNPLTKLISVGLVPFGAVENYFKRVIAMSELGAKGLKGLTKEEIATHRGLLSELNKAIDTYAFNYDNVPDLIKKFRESWWGWAAMPFPTYGYKLARYYSRYGAALNPFILMDPIDRLARLATLATLGGAGYTLAPGQERKHIEGMTSQVDTTGRSKIWEAGGKEQWLRTVKYPWFNLGHAMRGAEALFGGDEDVLGNVAGEFIAEGPLLEGLKLLPIFGKGGIGNRYEIYKPIGLRAGEIAAGFVPGTRLTQGIKAMQGGERVLPTDFIESVLNAVPFTGMHGKVQMDRITHKPVLLDANIEAFKFMLGLSMKEIDPARYNLERQRKLKAAITAVNDAKNLPDLNKAVDKLEDIDPEKLSSIANQIRNKRLILEGDTFDIVNGLLQRDSGAKRKVIDTIAEGIR